MQNSTKALISKLQQDILQWEGYKAPVAGTSGLMGLGPVEAVFPNKVFPISAVHELVCSTNEQVAATAGFITGLLSVLQCEGGACLWVGLSKTIFAPALKGFGIEPHKVIFINVLRDRDALWIIEEALKCTGLVAVIGEVSELDFKQSRRLQLAVEQSHVTGFIMRNAAKKQGATACAARWQISSLPSEPIDGLPGLGLPRWQVELLKVRNGQTGKWIMQWNGVEFVTIQDALTIERRQKYG
jgi:protein ImuA